MLLYKEAHTHLSRYDTRRERLGSATQQPVPLHLGGGAGFCFKMIGKILWPIARNFVPHTNFDTTPPYTPTLVQTSYTHFWDTHRHERANFLQHIQNLSETLTPHT